MAVLTAFLCTLLLPPSAIAMPAFTAGDVEAASFRQELARGAHGAVVLHVQVLMDRARYASGEIDAVFGRKLRQALRNFQRDTGLPVSGRLDALTWVRLHRDAAPLLRSYAIREGDVAGPFHEVPADMMAKAQLPALGHASALEALGERFHVSPEVLRRLNPRADFSRAGERILVPNVDGAPPLPPPAALVIDQSESTVALFDGAGRRLAQFPASMGSPHDPLPLGRWTVRSVVRDPIFRYNPELFWDADPAHSRADLAPGPNSPVGVVWIDLSKEHYGIHGTPEPGLIGRTQSHGCIRLTNWDALTLAKAVMRGMPVILQR